MKNVVPVLAILMSMIVLSCSQEKKLIRKASNSVERSDFDQAISYYDQVLKKDSNSYFANAGKGIVLSEYIGRHDQAIPYLEKALRKHPEKTGMKINYDLGKSYHFIGNYPRAIYFYGEASKFNTPDSRDYDVFLNKRLADCKYALEHPEVAPAEEQSVNNIGSAINTSMPEYGAVYIHNKLIFTSKRRDDDKEKKNGLDGRYFDAMYVSYVNKDSYSAPRRYTVPDIQGKKEFSMPHESVVSVSPDGKTLYIFRMGELYSTDLTDSTKSAHKLGGEVNNSDLQSHVTVSADGNTMIFASESDHGIGGLDLYKTVKDGNGSWSSPELLAFNTMYNEDAPFLSPNGTLFFSSNGLPGYGGYDVYKTHIENGQWILPANLGQPINSPGDEVYFTLNGNTSNGYYTSVRTGGYGDMDIYKVHYMETTVPECTQQDTLLVLNTQNDANNELAYTLSLQAPSKYQNIRSYRWKVNGESLAQTSNSLQYTFPSQGTYTISAKAVVYCDTCPTLLAMCSEKVIEVGKPVYASNDSLNNTTIAANTNTKSKTKPNKAAVSRNNLVLNEEQLKEMSWNPSPAYFDLNKSEIRSDAESVLDQNISVLKKNKNLIVTINGYADSRGSEAYNMGLSARRANSVRQYMLNHGVAKNRITGIHPYGETHLVNGCSDGVECSESEHQQNRRTEFEVINLVKGPADITLK